MKKVSVARWLNLYCSRSVDTLPLLWSKGNATPFWFRKSTSSKGNSAHHNEEQNQSLDVWVTIRETWEFLEICAFVYGKESPSVTMCREFCVIGFQLHVLVSLTGWHTYQRMERRHKFLFSAHLSFIRNKTHSAVTNSWKEHKVWSFVHQARREVDALALSSFTGCRGPRFCQTTIS